MTNAQNVSINYRNVTLKNLKATAIDETADAGGRKRTNENVLRLVVNDEFEALTTERFWESFRKQFHGQGVPKSFKLFSAQEIIDRLNTKGYDQRALRMCIENSGGKEKLLGLSDQSKAVIDFDSFNEISRQHGNGIVSYDNGVATMELAPRDGNQAFKIGGDDFKPRFILRTSVDGLGNTSFFTSLLRLVCQNGNVGYNPAFEQMIHLGKEDGIFSLNRAITCYDNEKSYHEIIQRMTSAQNSWASLNECQSMHDRFIKLGADNKTMGAFRAMTGNVVELYGLSNLNYMSKSKQAVMPAKCRVYDLINFATELATHHASIDVARKIHGLVGELLAFEYNLEGTAKAGEDFQDLFIEAKTVEISAPIAA